MATILILDDSATNRSIYARLAAAVDEAAAIETFADPLDALEWIGHGRVDLVITDFRMPGLDGAAFTRRLRALPGCGAVPVLVVTAHDDRSYRVRALDAGATDFLQSPIDHFEFVTRARNLLALGRQAPAAADPPAGLAPCAPDSLARILDAMPALVSATDREGRHVYANAAFAAWHGAQPTELLGAEAEGLLGPERGPRSRQADQAVFATGRALPAYEEDLPGREGRRCRLLTTKAPLRDAAGEVAAVLTTSLPLGPA